MPHIARVYDYWARTAARGRLVAAPGLHFCYIWLGQGGEKDVPFDDERALDAVATIWQKAVYWRAEPG